jgi:beta-N-acetylhexosaminidase
MRTPEERRAERAAKRRRAVRRRRALLGAAALVALVGGAAVGASRDRDAPRAGGAAAEEPPREQATPREPLQRAVGRLVVLRFAGTELPAYARRALREGRAGGVILFGDNVIEPAQLKRLTRDVRAASGGRALVLADQEGGEVRIVRWAGPERAAAAQAAAGAARGDARAAARELRAAGVTVSLAPVADVPTVAGAALASRAFADDPDAASRAVAAAVRGWREGGVAPTVKHFPGLGGATVNTDDGPADVAGRPDLAPFRAGIAAGAPLVMVGHARYPALDARRIASQSPAIVQGRLRRELGFRGVAITDSLEAAAVARRAPVDLAAERSVRAGVDLALTTGAGSAIRVYRRLLATARRSEAFRARVRESSSRVQRLQRAYAGGRP